MSIKTRNLGLALASAVGGILLVLCWLSGTPVQSLETVAPNRDVAEPTITLTQYVGGLSKPVHVTHADDGSGRLFIVEKAGVIRIAENGILSTTPFLVITDRVRSLGNEQGLLSVAFPPEYASKGYFYVNYTDLNGDTVVARYHVTAEPEVADPDSEQVILTITQPYANHNGGQLAFGPDGYLYIGMGDGGGAGDPDDNAQDPTALLGKILRIDVESTAFISPTSPLTHRIYLPLIHGGGGELPAYRIPPGNPFTQTVGYRDEIWALGLRNPWRFSFDRQAGDLYVGDVGQNSYEEIDFQPASSAGGENYGWDVMEGTHCYPSGPCDQTGLTLPVAEYEHALGRCSVTGGIVYRGSDPNLQGIYFYADYCSGEIWGLTYDGSWQSTPLKDTPYVITTFGEDEAGNLYAADFEGGGVYRITGSP